MSDYKSQWFSHLSELKGMHQNIADLCKGKKVAYLDLPFHYNVGDLLIYLGTEQFIQNHAINVRYRAFSKTINHKRLSDCDVIFFHGGGNFGDIYIEHQKFREKIIERYREKRIIILPSTIHYKSDSVLKKSLKVHSSHPDLHLFLRDQRSEKIAEGFSENITLMPDMAHSLHPLVEPCEVEELDAKPIKILNMRRVDVEAKTGAEMKTGVVKKPFDWDNILSSWDQILYQIAHAAEKCTRFSSNDKLIKLWLRQSNSLVFKSINYFNSFNLVYTDRMHGMILSYLLGKNIKMIDNSYGKNSSYYKLWLNESPLIELAENEAE